MTDKFWIIDVRKFYIASYFDFYVITNSTKFEHFYLYFNYTSPIMKRMMSEIIKGFGGDTQEEYQKKKKIRDKEFKEKEIEGAEKTININGRRIKYTINEGIRTFTDVNISSLNLTKIPNFATL